MISTNACSDAEEASPPYPYDGPDDLRLPVLAALRRVVDPEMALSIVDVGLVYGVRITADLAQVRMTMTSAACPVADLILEEVEAELDRVLPVECQIEIALCWEPAWTPERLSESAKRFMRW